jgi:hypothetical protein
MDIILSEEPADFVLMLEELALPFSNYIVTHCEDMCVLSAASGLSAHS